MNDAFAAGQSRRAHGAALEKRIVALEAGAGASSAADLDKRLGGVGSGSAGNGAASDATQRLAVLRGSEGFAGRVDAAKARFPDCRRASQTGDRLAED